MRWWFAVLAIVASVSPAWDAAAPAPAEFTSREAVLAWIYGHRKKPELARVPAAVRALSRLDAFKDPESSGVYLGFLAGVIGANRPRADELIGKLVTIPPEDHWLIVRAIAYSGAPDWKALLRKHAAAMPSRQAMIDKHLADALPNLDMFAVEKDPTAWETMRGYLRVNRYFGPKQPKPAKLEIGPETLDTLWGYYFASGSEVAVRRIVALLPWSKNRDDFEKLTVGSMAKYTLALNATRDAELLSILKRTRPAQDKEHGPILDDVIAAAETVDTPRLRKEALAAMEDLKRKGPASRRNVATWGQVGEGAIALGCIGAAVTGQVQLGLPCVLGGAVSSAALKFWASQ